MPHGVRLAAFLEEEILARSSTLTPRAICNLSSVLYGSGANLQYRKAAQQLHEIAMTKIHDFLAPELVDLASGLASCGVMKSECLQKLRDSMDARCVELDASSPENRPGEPARAVSHACSSVPVVLADFQTAFALSKPPGWSCATSKHNSTDVRRPLITTFLRGLDPKRAVSQDASVDHGLAHRLDIETSGALLAAKTFQGYWRLRLEFAAQEVERHYLALVHGDLSKEWKNLSLPLQLRRVPLPNTRSVRSMSVVSHDSGR